MKFGQLLESESVPEWSLHNIDYNTLKEFIKVNTTRHQASAITIPGQKDSSLGRFENDFYDELCRQHDRVGLFVATKADEINLRTQHLSDQIHRLLLRGTTSTRSATTLKRQRRYAKYERATLQLQDEIKDLSRFVNAQNVAFRKILKKYKKWTGSASLTIRFRDNFLCDPKSFTRRDFAYLESHCEDLLHVLRATTPIGSLPQTPREEVSPPDFPEIQQARRSSQGQGSSSSSTIQALSSSAGSTHPPLRPTSQRATRPTPLAAAPPQTHYWNEYDDGSEAGDIGGPGGGYAIYLHPDDEEGFPGMATLVSFFTVPIEKAKQWMSARGNNGPSLLSHADGFQGYGTTDGSDAGGLFDTIPRPGHGARARVSEGSPYFNHDGGNDDGDHESTEGDEDAFASDSDFPHGYEAHYASLPSINDQRIAQFRDTMLIRGDRKSVV